MCSSLIQHPHPNMKAIHQLFVSSLTVRSFGPLAHRLIPQPLDVCELRITLSLSFGSLAGLCLSVQIITCIFLAIHYTPHVDLSFLNSKSNRVSASSVTSHSTSKSYQLKSRTPLHEYIILIVA